MRFRSKQVERINNAADEYRAAADAGRKQDAKRALAVYERACRNASPAERSAAGVAEL